MPETTDIPVELPELPTVTFGRTGAVVIGGLATYGAFRLSYDTARKVRKTLEARKARKEIESQDKDNTPQ